MSATDARKLLAANCGVTASPTDHVASFTNQFGELLLFHQQPGQRAATFYHSDMGWEAIAVDDDAIRFEKEPIKIITVAGWIIDTEEAGWLARCLLATSEMRSCRRRPPENR